MKVTGKSQICYISQETQMTEYLNCHLGLEVLRTKAELLDIVGPIAMVAGPMDAGKSSLCSILLNYGVRLGRRQPLYVDLDVGQGSISIPGTIGAISITNPATIENGFSKTSPFIYHLGLKSPAFNDVLYNLIISKLAEVTLDFMSIKKRRMRLK